MCRRKLPPLLRTAGHDSVTARELRMEAAGDDEHLLVAAKTDRILVTYNVKDFRLLHDAWQRWSGDWNVARRHAGILIIPDSWLAPHATEQLDAFVQAVQSVANELHEWNQIWRQRHPR
ncbi:MAG: DUF5615 family PIN-like protein [Thermomicrobiales bacterium]